MTKNKACKFYDTTNTKCTTSNEERNEHLLYEQIVILSAWEQLLPLIGVLLYPKYQVHNTINIRTSDTTPH
ncbi:hypothetical protein PFBG_06142 [Plasmodium falciparum 7G8]|uniref:Uncharacterized protein n=1 Tax=Plasmodium falciparum (isolate 7G8) TaxID=57266 RepID=W7ESH5_PLAF8|nr:hypothetical protein PFBG_06142 [Plasmodium falciparum 7G8]